MKNLWKLQPDSDDELKQNDFISSIDHQFQLELQKQKDSVDYQSVSLNSEIKQIKITLWQFYQEYVKFFSGIESFGLNIQKALQNFDISTFQNIQFQQKLQQNNFFLMKFKPFKNQNQLKIKVVQKTQNYDIIEIFCQLGHFAKKYLVLNENKQSPRHQNNVIGFGSFSKIYQCHHLNQNSQSVIKCLKYEEDKVESLLYQIQEFFIYDLMSALQVGPKILTNNGFDFIIFQKCLEFQMQKCEPLQMKNIKKDLKDNLFKMHFLQIVHCDIKPANIMFSNQKNKNVILDFGTAQFIGVKWGSKVLTKFKGTYEFSSEEMKKTFMNNKFLQIDLYKNDIHMLKKSIQNISKVNQHFGQKISQSQKQKKLSKKVQDSNIKIHESLFYLKYQLYLNRSSKRLSNNLKSFLDLLVSSYPKKITQEILFYGIQFANRLDYQLVINLATDFIWKSAQLKYLDVSIDPIQLKQNKALLNLSKSLIREDNLFQKLQKIITENLQNKEKQFVEKKFNKNLKDESKNLQNFWFILSNKNQRKKFTKQQIYATFLEYFSFTDNQFSTTFQTKLKFAKQLYCFIEQTHQNGKNFEYFVIKHLPENNFCRKQNESITFSYAYLLDYCMNKEWNQFKTNYMLLILKNCMFLGFQYHHFLKQCIKFYFKNLLQTKQNKLITTFIVEIFQFIYLTNNHHLITFNKQEINYTEKYFDYNFKEVIQAIIQHIELKKDLKQFYNQKVNVLKMFVRLYDQKLTNEKCSNKDFYKVQNENNLNQQITQKQRDLNLIVKQIQKQFVQIGIKQGSNIFQRAVQYVIVLLIDQKSFSKITFNKLSSLFDLKNCQKKKLSHHKFTNFSLRLPLMSMIDYDKNQKYLQKFDNFIQYKQISDNFFLAQRLQLHIKKFNKQKVFKYFSLLTANYYPFLNWKTLIKVQTLQNIAADLFQMHLTIDQTITYATLFSEFLIQIVQLIKYFSQIESSFQELKSLLSLFQNPHYSRNYVNDTFRDQISRILSELNLVGRNKNLQFLVLRFLQSLEEQYSVEFQEIRKRNLQLLLNKLKQDQRNNNNTLTNNKLTQLQNSCLRHLIFQGNPSIDQVIKYWQNQKIKIYLKKSHFFADKQLQSLIKAFFRKKDVKQLSQLIFCFCKQKQFYLQPRLQVILFHSLRFIQDSMYHENQDVTPFFQCFYRYKMKEEKQIKLFPMYICLLNFTHYLKEKPHVWKKLLYQFYQLFGRLSRIDEITYQILLRYQSFSFSILKSFIQNSIQDILSKTNVDRQSNKKLQKIRTKLQRYKQIDLISLQEFKNKYNKKNWTDVNKTKDFSKLSQSECYQHQNQFRNRFKVKDLNMFVRNNSILIQFSTLYVSQKYNIPNPVSVNFDDIVKRIYQVKKSKEFEICQEIYDVIDEIIQIQSQKLNIQLFKEKGITPNEIQWIL